MVTCSILNPISGLMYLLFLLAKQSAPCSFFFFLNKFSYCHLRICGFWPSCCCLVDGPDCIANL
uniref:Pre-mRNA-splicing factor n=1 Tax=Rhizophora mucronata TaxID=61149 RepID=A0A2P2MLF8_RHIMU